MASIISGEIIAENVDFETFLREYMGQHVELIDGIVIKMSPGNLQHYNIIYFLSTFIRTYLRHTGEGQCYGDPISMGIPGQTKMRQPDLFVLKTAHLSRLKETYLEGAADLIIEVVSPESSVRDRGEKFHEYEKLGVQEYWIIDPVHQENLFYTQDETGIFRARPLDKEGYYTSLILPQLRFQPAILLEETTPDAETAIQMIKTLLKD